MFWPREIWGQYAPELEDFKDPTNRVAAVQCLNNLVGLLAPAVGGRGGAIGS